MNNIVRFLAVVLMVSISTLVVLPAGPANAEYPSKDILIVVQASPGGGSDIFCRTVAEVIKVNNLMPVNFSVINKPGGSSSVAKAFAAERAGDPYVWLSTTSSFTTSYVLGQSKLSRRDFTPLGLLLRDSQVIFTRPDSPYKSMADIVKAAKKGIIMNWAGTNVGSSEHVCAHLVGKAIGTKFNFVGFTGGGEINAAILGGHVELAVGNPQEILGLVEAGKIRALASTAAKRVDSLPDVPTLKEQGIDVVTATIRGFNAPKGIPKEATDYMDKMFPKLMATPQFQKYAKDNSLIKDHLTSEEFGKELAEQEEFYRNVLGELGLKIKN